jgi:hypothetical protein
VPLDCASCSHHLPLELRPLVHVVNLSNWRRVAAVLPIFRPPWIRSEASVKPTTSDTTRPRRRSQRRSAAVGFSCSEP